MFDFNRREPLFSEVIPITLTELHATKFPNLVFRLLSGKFTNVNGQVQDVFRLEITDDNEHNFLYYFDALESEFHHLKSLLRLTFEFGKFPEMLVKHLKQCLKDENQVHEDSPRFTVKLEKQLVENGCELGKLTFIETNQYKETDLLVLSCTKGDDKAIISYLSARLSLTLNIESDQSIDIDDLQNKLAHMEAANLTLNGELDQER